MTLEELRFDILKTELELVQRQMDKYDQASTAIKKWTMALWGILVGGSFPVNRSEILLLSIAAVIFFWIYDARINTYRAGYKNRRGEVVEALNEFFAKGAAPDGFSAPCPPEHRSIEIDTLKNAAALHVALPYLVLGALSLALWWWKF